MVCEGVKLLCVKLAEAPRRGLQMSGFEVPTVKFGTSGSLVTKQAGWERWEEITLHQLHRLSGVSDFPAITC